MATPPHTATTRAPSSPDEKLPYLPSKLFHVKNVDDKGRIIHIGYLEITDSDIIFTYEHYPNEFSKWPLGCIRKYGINLDGNIFVLETGRRAPNGEGLFAFRTDEAYEIRRRIDYYTNAKASGSSTVQS